MTTSPGLWILLSGVLVFSSRVKSQFRLYHPIDNVNQINAEEVGFVLDQPTSKLVQFYNSFNEDCISFAPTFKSLARDLRDWDRLLKVYAIDCAKDENIRTCDKLEVSKMPLVRYYPPKFDRNLVGIEIASRKPDAIKQHLTSYLSQLKHSPEDEELFKPLTKEDSADGVFITQNSVYNSIKNVVLVYQPKSSLIGIRTVLELLSLKSLKVRIIEDRQIFAKFGLKPSTQNLAFVNRYGSHLFLTPQMETGESYAATVKEHLMSLGVKIRKKPPTTKTPSLKELFDMKQKAILSQAVERPLRVYQADMIKGIEDFLVTILPNIPLIAGKSKTALESFMKLLSKYHPLNGKGDGLMIGVVWEVEKSNGLTGKQLSEKLKSREDFGKVFDVKHYIGCTSSRPHERGYPCALWTLFHNLLVQNLNSVDEYTHPPGDILSIFRDFIKYFYQCPQCVGNFEGMVKRRPIHSEMTHKEAILWLWTTHNEFNRLTADQDGDPMFPKVQFPSADRCPTCRNNNSSWRNNEVLKYLKRLHRFDNLSRYGLPNL